MIQEETHISFMIFSKILRQNLRFVWILSSLQRVRGNLQKKTSIYKDIIQIEVDPPPSHPTFDKFIFDTVLIMMTSLPPLEFLTKIMKF